MSSSPIANANAEMPVTDEAATLIAPEAPKKRGRKPKTEKPEAANTEDATAPVAEKKKRGRKPKADADATETDAETETAAAFEENIDAPPAEKKKRGRKPKKSEGTEAIEAAADAVANAAPKKRGRKPKLVIEAPDVNVPSEGTQKKRGRKAANAEKPPRRTRTPTAYNLFLKEVLTRLVAKDPKETPQNRMRQAVEEWRAHKATLATAAPPSSPTASVRA